MTIVREASVSAFGTLESTYTLEILSQASCGNWELKLPSTLKTHQGELEGLLAKVFSGRPRSSENLELAQQMTLNWCLSKYRKLGIKPDAQWLQDSN